MKSKFLKKIINFFKNNWTICLVILGSLILHLFAMKELSFKYNLNSDDISYIKSGITFLKTGTITMHGVISAQIMPGLTFFIAFIALLLGTGYRLIIGLKIIWLLLGICNIIVIYKIVRLYTNQYCASFASLFFLSVDYIWMDNIILTETPIILLTSLLIYHTLKLSIKANIKDYILIIVYYILAVFIRPNVGIFPVLLFIFLLIKKYDFKLLIKQCFIAGIVLLLCLAPWTYRNYKVFHKFIPLTYGSGNPLLLGTYQGYGYPTDEELDYTEIDKFMNNEMKKALKKKDSSSYMNKYYQLEKDNLIAKYRMKKWWEKDKKSMLISYLFIKPKILFTDLFYWKEILGISTKILKYIRIIELLLFILSSLLIIIDKKWIKEWLFIMFFYISEILIYSYTFAFSRYGIELYFMRYIIIGIGISILANYIKLLKLKRGN